MKGTLKLIVLVALLVGWQQSGLMAQTLGYTNSAALLMEMPETAAADQQLETYQQQLQAEFAEKESNLATLYEAYIAEANTGNLTRVQMQEKEAELMQLQQELQLLDQQLLVKYQEKREALYTPILNKLQTAIDQVGQENGYTMIFDVSVMNLLLFADDTDDVTELVKAKL
jgi:outer membrane protein